MSIIALLLLVALMIPIMGIVFDSPIGRALARRFAQEGAQILAADLREAAAEDTAAVIRSAGGRAAGYAVDVTDLAAVADLRRRVNQDGGPIDVLVNNAGVVHGGAFLDVPLLEHLATYRVNIDGVVIMTHAFLSDLLGRPASHLVQIASASGFVGLPLGATYASSKWAVIGFSESIRMELRQLGHRHVGVTTVCPSYVLTGMFDGARAPRLTRLLTADRVADLTVRAVRRNRAYVLTPWLVKLTPMLNAALPRWAFDRLSGVFGVTTSMTSWHGRGPQRNGSASKRG
jgi:all-trans-retinol dehydrogenase (NAD+)